MGGDEGRVPERARGLRRTATVAGIAALALAGWAAAPVYGFHIPTFIGLLIAVVQAVAGWAYAQELARRIPSRRLETFAKYLWIAVLVAFASVVLRGSAWVVWALYSPWSRLVIGWTLFLIAYPPLAIAMYLTLARRFRSAAKAATKNWEVESSS
jgi:ABC-type iron transport system FetAB permease component